ncbi:MAG TPA: hypothetical protein EYH31_10665 [Anaerolineae bacterium]|nr:hypothetical protein [Anaerolineae bacterium]
MSGLQDDGLTSASVKSYPVLIVWLVESMGLGRAVQGDGLRLGAVVIRLVGVAGYLRGGSG